jgi:hypothetical protein
MALPRVAFGSLPAKRSANASSCAHFSLMSCAAGSEMFALNSGHSIPAVGLGVYQAANGDEAYEACLNALKMGYRHIDTAQIYRNEGSVGRAIKDSGVQHPLPPNQPSAPLGMHLHFLECLFNNAKRFPASKFSSQQSSGAKPATGARLQWTS